MTGGSEYEVYRFGGYCVSHSTGLASSGTGPACAICEQPLSLYRGAPPLPHPGTGVQPLPPRSRCTPTFTTKEAGTWRLI